MLEAIYKTQHTLVCVCKMLSWFRLRTEQMLNYIRNTFKQSTQARTLLCEFNHLKVFLYLLSPGVRKEFVTTRETEFPSAHKSTNKDVCLRARLCLRDF